MKFFVEGIVYIKEEIEKTSKTDQHIKQQNRYHCFL